MLTANGLGIKVLVVNTPASVLQ